MDTADIDHADFIGLPAYLDQKDRSILSRPLQRFLAALDVRSRHWSIRYALATPIVGIFFVLVMVLQGNGRPEGFFVLLAAIFVSAIFCGCGIFTTFLSTALLYVLVLPPNTATLPMRFVPALVIFLIAGLGVAILSEALQSALDRASAADRAKDILLRELDHRTKNNLAMVVSILSLESGLTRNPESRLRTPTITFTPRLIASRSIIRRLK